VVEQTLDGNADQVKERSIGMEVFGRQPGYDANADPVVRVTAGEIRKRLAQYYYDAAHQDELRIELPTGSYVPVFQRFVEAETEVDVSAEAGEASAAEPALNGGSSATANSMQTPFFVQTMGAAPSPRGTVHLLLTALLVVVALVIGLAAGAFFRAAPSVPVATVWPDQAAMDDFWKPMTTGPATVTFCLGEPARDSSRDFSNDGDPAHADPARVIEKPKLAVPLYFQLRQSGLFALADVVTLTRMSAILEKQHKAYRVSAASEASFGELREGPAVIIGAYDNLWTMRLTRNLRFGFDSVDGNAFIVDRKSKTKTTWTMAWDLPYEKLARDYAIVARYRDGLTGQPVVIAAGISEEGTEAAGELISNPADLAKLLAKAPANWRNMNMEAVVETQVIDGHSGPPEIRAVEFW
jgi:hypothetical protein